MTISNGQLANQDNFNNAFHSRTAAQDVENKTIDGTSATGSNDVTTDADKVTIESNGNYYNADDNLDTAVSGVDTQVKTNETDIGINEADIDNIETDITNRFSTSTGHRHDGTDSRKTRTTDQDTSGGKDKEFWIANGSGGGSWVKSIFSTLGAFVNHVFSNDNVTDTAYTELINDIGATAGKSVRIFYAGGEPIYLAIGAASSESNSMIIWPGMDDEIGIDIPVNERLSLRSVNTGITINSGTLIINVLG